MRRDPTPDEILAVVEACANEGTVLIGGMAVTLLARASGIAVDTPVLTLDADFFGGRRAMERSRRALPWKATEFVATMDDATPNSGKLVVEVDAAAKPVEVDFLRALDEISSDDIETRAVDIEIRAGKSIRVMHPMLLLENKVNNLAMYPKKRNQAGIEQAKIALQLAKGYMSGLKEERRQLEAIERIARFAARDPACYAHKVFGIDVLEAIPAPALSARFEAIRRPQIVQSIVDCRADFDRAWERTARFRDPKQRRYRP